MKLAKPVDKSDIAQVSKLRAERGLLRRSAGEAKWSSRNDVAAHLFPQARSPAPQAVHAAPARPVAGYRGGFRSLIIILKSLLIVAIVMPLSILTLMVCILSIEWIVFEEIRMTFLM